MRRGSRIGVAIGIALLLGIAGGYGLNDWQNREMVARKAAVLTHGDPEAGRAAIGRFGCGGCHAIPGVGGARGLVGPPLGGIARRAYIGGVAANTPDHMVGWIRNPKAFDDRTAMPALGIGEDDARDIAAFLYTLD